VRNALIGLALTLACAAPAAAREQLPAVLHVHSTLSTGNMSLDELATTAQADGVVALFLTENYLTHVEYGLPGFRALTRVSYDDNAVFPRLEDYFQQVAELRRRFPKMLIVPGVEVIPHYYWVESPLSLELRLQDTQKNLLIFGLDPPALRTLSISGNPGHRVFTPRVLFDLVPALLILPGLIVLSRPRVLRRRLGTAVIVVRQRRWLAGGLLVAIGLVAIVRAFPFTTDRYPPWADYGLDPHQTLIDEVQGHGGAIIWSFPEAPDAGEKAFGAVKVIWKTEPYPDDLLRTSNYTAFGAVYEQTIRVTRPGGQWDSVLNQYVKGERARPAWGLGEAGYHGKRTGKKLTTIQTVLSVDQRTEAAAIDALKRGRHYSVRRSDTLTLALPDFGITVSGATAGMGDVLAVPAGTPLEVHATVEAVGGASQGVRVTLVKNGEVAGVWTGNTPYRVLHKDVAGAARAYYRLDARVSPGEYLVSNPIFVAPP
jgi:hypothetical protein